MSYHIDDDNYRMLTEFCNRRDNREDGLRRAAILGIGKGSMVAPGALVRIPTNQIGANVYFGLYSYCNGNVTVGDNVLIGPHCSIAAGNHKFDPATGWFSGRTEPDGDDSIVIGDGCWLASHVMISAGVKLGKANLICAGAVVTKSTEDYAIMAGIPAKQVGRIDPVTGEYHWFSRENLSCEKNEQPDMDHDGTGA